MTWMCAIAKNQYLDFVRKNKKNNSVDYDEVENYVSEGMEKQSPQMKNVEDKNVNRTYI